MNGTTLGFSFVDNENMNDLKETISNELIMSNTTKKYKPADILKKLKNKPQQQPKPMRETFRSQISAFNEDEQQGMLQHPISMGSVNKSLNEQQIQHPLINATETFENYDMGISNREHFTTEPKNNDNPTNMFYDFGRHMDSSKTSMNTVSTTDNLQEKINYIIHMLEQNKQMRTENIHEEMVMYFFLGFFVLYVSDNFVKMGRYTR